MLDKGLVPVLGGIDIEAATYEESTLEDIAAGEGFRLVLGLVRQTADAPYTVADDALEELLHSLRRDGEKPPKWDEKLSEISIPSSPPMRMYIGLHKNKLWPERLEDPAAFIAIVDKKAETSLVYYSDATHKVHVCNSEDEELDVYEDALEKEAQHLRAKHKAVKPTLAQIKDLENELQQYEMMDIDDPEENTKQGPELSELELLQQQRRQLDEHEAEVRRRTGSEPQENRLFVDSDDYSGYESDVVIPIETSGSLFGITPPDGKDLCFTKRGRGYYIIYQRGPDRGNRVYEARRASLRTCEDLELERVVDQRPKPGTFELTGIQGVVVAPGCDYQVLLRKNWKVEHKMDVPTQKYPWFQVKIQYAVKGDRDKNGKTKKRSAFFSRSALGQIFPDSHGVLTLDEDLCFNDDVVLEEGTSIPKLDLAILRAYILNQENYGKRSSRARSSRSPTVQRYSTPALNATRGDKDSSISGKGKIANTVTFAAPASRNSNPLGAAQSAKQAADYAEFLAWRKATAQGDPPMHPDMVANRAAMFGKHASIKEEEEEEL
ncbi:hypothetical protein ARSEF4850_009485 [Beauveria asiatica]